ncbi:MAG: SRPBCC family protein [Gammaproteobacteria bacterium]
MNRVHIDEQIVIGVSPSTVWELMGNFGEMSPWFPSAEHCSVTGSGVGAVRRLQMPDGGVLLEEQTERVEGEHYQYKIIEGEVPFSDYSSCFAVRAEGEGTRVVWTASFIPAAGAEQSAAEFVSTVYRGGLESARKLLEATG